MGKPTGFMDYKREVSRDAEPKERIKNFMEFHEHLPLERQRLQGARCMECGVPFCQAGMNLCGMTSGCPLHNLVPEWNDLVYTGNLQQAHKDQQLSGVYIQGLPRPVRGGLHLQSCGRAGSHEGKRICHH